MTMEVEISILFGNTSIYNPYELAVSKALFTRKVLRRFKKIASSLNGVSEKPITLLKMTRNLKCEQGSSSILD